MTKINISFKDYLKDIIEKNKNISYFYKNIFPNTKYNLSDIIDGILYILKTGICWRDYKGSVKWNSLYFHYQRFVDNDIFKKLYIKLRSIYLKNNSSNVYIVDSSFIMNKYGKNNIARNRFFKSKNCNKVSFITDINGIPLSVLVNKGNVHDLSFVDKHLKDLLIINRKNKYCKYTLLADKAYESKNVREKLNILNISLMIPKKINLKKTYPFNKKLYKKRIIIDNKTIKELESELSNLSAKTTDTTKFKLYVKQKIKLKELIKKNEYNTYVSKLKWYGFINKKRHEDDLLNDLERIYGKDAVFILGDWSNRGNLKYISTPNIGMKRLLSKRFKVYLIDEYNTSKLSYKTEEKCENLVVKIKPKDNTKEIEKLSELNIEQIKIISELKKVKSNIKNLITINKNMKIIKNYEKKRNKIKIRNKILCDLIEKEKNRIEYKKELHAVLTYQMSNGKQVCINRDYNAVLNMQKIVKQLIKTGERPNCFTREQKILPTQITSCSQVVTVASKTKKV